MVRVFEVEDDANAVNIIQLTRDTCKKRETGFTGLIQDLQDKNPVHHENIL